MEIPKLKNRYQHRRLDAVGNAKSIEEAVNDLTIIAGQNLQSPKAKIHCELQSS